MSETPSKKLWKKKHTYNLTTTFFLSNESDTALVEHLNKQERKGGYIKDLIRADMQKTAANAPKTPERAELTCDTCKAQDCDRRRPKQARCGEYEQ